MLKAIVLIKLSQSDVQPHSLCMVLMYAEYLHGAQGFILDDLHIGHNLMASGYN